DPCGPIVRAAAAAGAEICLLIGPEGGFDRDEVAQAQAAGWQVIGLGARILRAETASLAAVAALMALAGELGSLGAPGA
ncbi:MAG: RsmE family RNA methyltransferase, partial [Caldilineaceae bacterium]